LKNVHKRIYIFITLKISGKNIFYYYCYKLIPKYSLHFYFMIFLSLSCVMALHKCIEILSCYIYYKKNLIKSFELIEISLGKRNT